MIEDNDLSIVNETISNEEDQDLPIRNLDGFSIYDEDYQLCDFSKHRSGCLASGFVSPHYNHDEEEEDEINSDASSDSGELDAQYVKLSKLVEVWIDMDEYEDPYVISVRTIGRILICC